MLTIFRRGSPENSPISATLGKGALTLISRGFKIFPLKERGKTPLTLHGVLEASCDPRQIETWASEYPNANVGISTEGFPTLDVDPRHDGDKSLAALVATQGPLTDTLVSATGGGGEHWIYRAPPGVKLRNSEGRLAPGLDVRADGGYIVSPPSVHDVTGQPYKWNNRIPPVELSGWLLEKLLNLTAVPTPPLPANNGQPHAIHEGQGRHRMLLELAGSLRRRGFSPEAILAQLILSNQSLCKPPVEDSWFEKNAKYWSKWEPGNRSPMKEMLDVDLRLESYDMTPKEHLRYLWSSYLPLGKLVHIAGHSTEGKTPILTDLAARISVGAAWPDGTPNKLGPRSVILLSAEDDPADTMRPRLEVAGADLKKIFRAIATVQKDQTAHEKMLALGRDLHKLTELARKIPDLAFIAIDPITNYMGEGVSFNSEDEVRPILMPLGLAASQLNITITTVGHLNRREKGTEALHRIMGAAAFHGVARFVYIAGPDPEDEDQFAHVLVQRRGVGAPALRYQTFTTPLTWNNETSDVLGLRWRGRSLATAEQIVDPAGTEEKSIIARAAVALREILRAGPVHSTEAQKQLADAGFSAVNQTRLHRAAGADSKRLPGDKFYSWFLVAKEPA